MKLRLSFLLVFLFALGLPSAFAQTAVLEGTVKDEAGEPLIGAAIVVKGTSQVALTDAKGAYRINVSPEQTLLFSYVGMDLQEYKVTPATKTLNVVLKSNNTMNEAVIIGYGSAKKIGTTIGSTATVTAKDLTSSSASNVLDVLQGKVAGLSINATSGAPGSSPIVLLHGLGTLIDVNNTANYSTPLYVVDGLPVDDDLVSTLNLDDLESVTVLKDASATSIYGARAAYGVIYIRTKKGSYEQPTEVSFNTQSGFSRIASDQFYRNLLSASEYMDYMVGLGHITKADADKLVEKYNGNTRWDKIYFKPNSFTTQTNLSIRGGGKNTSFYLSGGYVNQDGVRYGSGYERYSLRTNVDTRITDWLSVNLSVALGHAISTSNGGERGQLGGVMALPIYSAYDSEGNLLNYVETVRGNARFYLPQYTASKLLNSNGTTNVVPNFRLTITPIQNLTFQSQAGLQYSYGVNESKDLPSFDANNGVGSVSRNTAQTLNRTFTNTLEYKFRINEDHAFTALVGQESVSNTSVGFGARSEGQVADGLTTLLQGKTNISVTDGKDVSTYNSVFSRLDYSYANRYYADFSLRQDGSSTFGKNNRYATFWSAGVMWNAKQEQFMQNVSWVDELRLKISSGTSGSRGGAGSYGSYSRLNFGQYAQEISYQLSRLGNPDLRWEKQAKTTLGLTLGLFNRLRMEVDIYERVIKDMFFTEELPMITGFTIRPTNLAKLRSRGVDLTLSVTAYKNKAHNISIIPYFNVNYNDLRVLELATGDQLTPTAAFATGYEKGSQLMIFAPIFKGVDPSNGNPIWYVPGTDKMATTTDDSNVTNRYNATTLNQNTGKKAYAPWNGGFGLNATYKDFSLQVAFAFSAGRYQTNLDRYNTESNAPFVYNVSRESLDYWKEPGQIARNPRKELQFIQRDSRLLEDASFIRLKNINLGYTFPKRITEKIGFVKAMRVFVTGRNLLTLTKFTGPDPEFSVLLSSGGYPSTREYTMGVEVKF